MSPSHWALIGIVEFAIAAYVSWPFRSAIFCWPPWKSFVKHTNPFPQLSDSAQVKLTINTWDLEYLAEAESYVTAAFDEEKDRLATVESKATTVVSALGIAAGLFAGASTIFLGIGQGTPHDLLVAIAIMYGTSLLLLLLALATAERAMRVDKTAYPNPRDVVNIQESPWRRRALRREAIASLLVSHSQVVYVNNRKARWLQLALRSFVAAGFAIVVGAALLGSYALLFRMGILCQLFDLCVRSNPSFPSL